MNKVNISHKDLMSVESPGRYVGGEPNQCIKEYVINQLEQNGTCKEVRTAFCFPDIYEIGMSNLAMQILYNVINSEEYNYCERAFTPWHDMIKLMREKNIPLFTLETGSPLSDFDIVAFTLGYEMCYTNVLLMMDLGNIPLKSTDRKENDPVVICGGPVAYNIEPMCDFFDAVLMGEGEEMILEVTQAVKRYKDSGKRNRHELLLELSKISGVYIPSFYKAEFEDNYSGKEYFVDAVRIVKNEDGTVSEYPVEFSKIAPRQTGLIKTEASAPDIITKRIISDLDNALYPENPIVPNMGIVHDRAYLEVFRGCIRGCRFCQAGFIYRPVREKSAETLCRQGIAIEHNTGYDELGILSLSSSDYTGLKELTDGLLDAFEGRHSSLSLPSLRIDNFALDLMEKVSSTRKTGLTFAPEAGTQRLRDVINKGITEEDIMSSLKLAFSGGWGTVKLYFMLGLPTETMEDVEGIADLAKKIEKLYFDTVHELGIKARKPEITVSTSMYIPKPFTPFQWERQNCKEEFLKKQAFLKSRLKSKNIKYSWHDVESSLWEVVLARGDRRLNQVLLEGYKAGLVFDAWDDSFNFAKWTEILLKNGLSWETYAREYSTDEVLPWQHINVGVRKDFLISEKNKAYSETVTPNCREKCSACGANCFKVGECYASR
ncbi:MAG: TIGR03960 family B12-binding radical SAM protein [Clostridia bacterium]|nr:TIGR03960 family B12-binding radical SAM protein [Clostridia bacterium]